MKIGSRIAICSADMSVFMGYGIYRGDEPCPLLGGITNPKLVNDAGEEFWGCETWWIPAEEFITVVSRAEGGIEWLKHIEREGGNDEAKPGSSSLGAGKNKA